MSETLERMVEFDCYCDAETLNSAWGDQGWNHMQSCPQFPMGGTPAPWTKAEYVTDTQAKAKHAIALYRMLLNDLDLTSDDAMKMAVDQIGEDAACYAGIGQCLYGSCQHT